VTGAHENEPHVVVELLGRRSHVLDLSREISPDIPIYPGHAKVAFWWHLTHDEVNAWGNEAQIDPCAGGDERLPAPTAAGCEPDAGCRAP
jgi:hypothetical protein